MPSYAAGVTLRQTLMGVASTTWRRPQAEVPPPRPGPGVELLRIPIRDGQVVVHVTEPRRPSFDHPSYEQTRRATLTIDCGVIQVVEPNLFLLDSDLDELSACLRDLEARRETTWLATSGRSPYLKFCRRSDDPADWDVVFCDEPASGAEVRAYTTLDWVDHGRGLLEALRAVEGAG
jgi:hypothetical protein